MSISSAALLAAKDGWAVGPLEAPAVLRATGRDAKDYLHRMTTQDLNALPPGGSAYTAILNAKGHLLADAHALVEEDGVLLVMDPRAAPEARAHLERFVIMDDVTFEDLSASVRNLPVLGPQAGVRLGVRGTRVPRIANRRRGVPALDLLLSPPDALALRATLVQEGAHALSTDELEVLRILAGQARWGVDMDQSRLPMEAGLTSAAISFTKGCYTGQEVVLRATARGHLQRGLVQLSLPHGACPGTPLSSGGEEIGAVTSAADGPEGPIGLGYVRRAQFRVGERLETPFGEAAVLRAIVEEGLPQA
jgi:folate-binding protein YgfZ